MAFEIREVKNFSGGLNLDIRPDLLDESESPNCKNIYFDNNYVIIDQDTSSVVSNQISGGGGTVDGTIKNLFSLQKRNGTEELLLFTTTSLYRQDGNDWALVANGFSGTTTDEVVAITWTPDDDVIWTNGVDPVQRYDSSVQTNAALVGLDGTSTYPTVDNCKDLITFQDRLFLFNTEESGGSYPQRIRWSDVANPEEWRIASVLATSDAGFQDLLDKEDKIIRAEPLNNNLIIYRVNSIVRGTWVASANVTIDFDEVISNDSILSYDSLVNVSDFHVLATKTNIYIYTGGISMQPIGDPVYDRIYGNNGIADLDNLQFSRGVYVSSLKEVWLFFSNTSSISFAIRYSIRFKHWMYKEFDYLIYNATSLKIPSPTSWDSYSSLTWDDANFNWDSQTFSSSLPNLHIIRSSSIETFDQTTSGTSEYIFDTKEFTFNGQYVRFEYIEIYMQGSNVSIQISTDRGLNWSVISNVTVNELRRERIWYNSTARSFMFRFSGSGGSFQLSHLKFKYQIESDW